MKQKLKISIITPSFNQGLYIERTIKSVLNQNYPNLEYIVMDGKSTDNTINILKKYDSKVIWRSEKDGGQTNAINKGIQIATGEIIGYLNSDDTLEPGSLAEVSDFFSLHQKENFVYGLGRLIDKNDRYLEDYHNGKCDYKTLFVSCDISQPSAFWRKSLTKKIGLFNEKFGYAMDYEYWVRVSKRYKLNYINKYLSNTRIHEQTKTNSQTQKVHLDVFNVQLKNYGKVEDNWLISYSHILLRNKNNNFRLIRQFFILNLLQLKYNHRLISGIQLLYLLRQIKRRLNNLFIDRIRKRVLGPHQEIGILYQHAPREIFLEKFPQVKTKKYSTISIVTPSFNQGKYIGRTIDSVVKQKYPKLEYVVKDGKSTDDTVDVLNRHKNMISFESSKDNGQTDAINKAFRRTSGEIMAYLNSDDMYCQDALQFVNDYFQRNPRVDVIYGNRLIVDQNDKQIGRWVLPPCNINVLKYLDYVPQETMFWRRSIWEKVGGKLDESFDFAMDWDLIVRFIEIGANIKHVPYFLGMFRYHSQQKTSTKQNTTGQKECDRILHRLHHIRIPQEDIVRLLEKYRYKSAFFSTLFDLGIRI